MRLMEDRNKLLAIILSVSIAFLGYLTYQVLKPYWHPILWAIILAVAFHPMHRFIQKFT
jgi:predicted PurR-regulated permease PerM